MLGPSIFLKSEEGRVMAAFSLENRVVLSPNCLVGTP